MSEIHITGYSRGLGKSLYNYYLDRGLVVVGYGRENSLNSISSKVTTCDLFIINSYADGKQIDLLNEIYNKVKKIVVMGSVVSYQPDPLLPEYSKNKKILTERIRELQRNKLPNCADILLLQLSAKSYNQPNLILKMIDIWLLNNTICEISFDPSGDPNR
jgi:short-subunit dehydrogenase